MDQDPRIRIRVRVPSNSFRKFSCDIYREEMDPRLPSVDPVMFFKILDLC